MDTITSAELQKHFGLYRERALREPVSITHHGRESLVILSADEFRRLKALDERQAFYVWELPDDLANALKAAVPADETGQHDSEIYS